MILSGQSKSDDLLAESPIWLAPFWLVCVNITFDKHQASSRDRINVWTIAYITTPSPVEVACQLRFRPNQANTNSDIKIP